MAIWYTVILTPFSGPIFSADGITNNKAGPCENHHGTPSLPEGFTRIYPLRNCDVPLSYGVFYSFPKMDKSSTQHLNPQTFRPLCRSSPVNSSRISPFGNTTQLGGKTVSHPASHHPIIPRETQEKPPARCWSNPHRKPGETQNANMFPENAWVMIG